MNSDPACRCNGSNEYESEEVSVNDNGTLANVFVYVSRGLGHQAFPIPKDSVVLDQRGCRYVPHVFGIRARQVLVILNSDDTMHNVHASARLNKPFNIGMTRVAKRITRTFARPEVMVPIRCNVHPWMSAYAGVLDHPYFQVTGADGSYRLDRLPPGEYTVTAWHERFGSLEQRVTLADSTNRVVDFEFTSH